MRQHPEQRNDEIFVGNTCGTGVPQYLSGIKTARVGQQAYPLYGPAIPPDQMRPLFVGRGEAAQYDAIMMARLSKP